LRASWGAFVMSAELDGVTEGHRVIFGVINLCIPMKAKKAFACLFGWFVIWLNSAVGHLACGPAKRPFLCEFSSGSDVENGFTQVGAP